MLRVGCGWRGKDVGYQYVTHCATYARFNSPSTSQAHPVGEKILAALNQTYPLASYQRRSMPSSGITLFGDRQERIDVPY